MVPLFPGPLRHRRGDASVELTLAALNRHRMPAPWPPVADQRPRPSKVLPPKLSHPRTAARPWLRSNGKGHLGCAIQHPFGFIAAEVPGGCRSGRRRCRAGLAGSRPGRAGSSRRRLARIRYCCGTRRDWQGGVLTNGRTTMGTPRPGWPRQGRPGQLRASGRHSGTDASDCSLPMAQCLARYAWVVHPASVPGTLQAWTRRLLRCGVAERSERPLPQHHATRQAERSPDHPKCGRSGHSRQVLRCINTGLAAWLLSRSRDCQWCGALVMTAHVPARYGRFRSLDGDDKILVYNA